MRNLDLYRNVAMRNTPSLWNMLDDVDDFFSLATNNKTAFSPRANIQETSQAYQLNFDLPGVKKEDVKIDVHGRTLTVSGERKHEAATDEAGYQRYECISGTFERSFTLPEGVEMGRVDAVLTDGVLRVTLPKAEAEKPRKIEVK